MTSTIDPLVRRVVARFEAMENRGEVGVDSGSLLVIDPAYVKYWGTGEHPELDYNSVMNSTGPAMQLHFNNGIPAAVLISNFGGDGSYPVLTESVAKDDTHGEMLGSFAVDLSGPPTSGSTMVARVVAKSKKKVTERTKKQTQRVEQLRQSVMAVRKKVQKDLRSRDPEKVLTALAVGLVDHAYEPETGSDDHFGVTGWKRKHVSFGPKSATLKYTRKGGKYEKRVTDAVIKKALRDAYQALDDDEADLLAWHGGRVTTEKVADYLKPFGITGADLRGFQANQVLQDQLKSVRETGGELPAGRKARDKKLRAEFAKALAETAKTVGHDAARLRSDYLVPGLEAQFMKFGTISDKVGFVLSDDLTERVVGRFLYL